MAKKSGGQHPSKRVENERGTGGHSVCVLVGKWKINTVCREQDEEHCVMAEGERNGSSSHVI